MWQPSQFHARNSLPRHQEPGARLATQVRALGRRPINHGGVRPAAALENVDVFRRPNMQNQGPTLSTPVSNANKQLSGRRLPPLPGCSNIQTLIGKGYSLGDLENSDGVMNPDFIKRYLKKHPNLLDDFVLEHVEEERIATWLYKKKNNNYEQEDGRSAASLPHSEDHDHTGFKLHDIGSISASPPPCEASYVKMCSSSDSELHTRYKSCDVENVLSVLTQEIRLSPVDEKSYFLHEIGVIAGAATRADSYAVYLVCSAGKELIQTLPKDNQHTAPHGTHQPITEGSTVAAYVAEHKKTVLLRDIHGDERFPLGTGCDQTSSVLCIPLLLGIDLIGVIEFSKRFDSKPFSKDDQQIVTAMVTWAAGFLLECEVNGVAVKQRELNDFLLEVSRVIFDDIITSDKLVSRIMMFAKNLVAASRCSFFLVDLERNELYADLFDEGVEDDASQSILKKQPIRFSIDKGIAGHVAKTGEIVNIKNAYEDPRFNRDIDIRTGFTTQNILCMPIISKGVVIGVVQMINKLSGTCFTATDEAAFKTFAVYCALALHYSKMYSSLKHQQSMNRVALEQLSYHIRSEDACQMLLASPLPDRIPESFNTLDFYCKEYESELPQLFNYIVQTFAKSVKVDLIKLCHFVTTVRKNYRPISYHNWRHAFTVCHCMYFVLLQIPGVFREEEELALLVSCICHDLDHRGYNNAFMQKLEQPLASLYSTSVMEQHHFNMTVTILQQEDHDIFSHLSQAQYKDMLDNIRTAIIATDLALYFGNQKKIEKLISNKEFDVEVNEHRNLLKAIMMTGCDLCAVSKPWPVQQAIVRLIYAEFYDQGDKEKMMGMKPLPLMDRNQKKNVPKDQCGFIKFVCMPGFRNLKDILQNEGVSILLSNCESNLRHWEEIAAEVERTDEILWDVTSTDS
ncbi:cAMP and cAMP-inhibited cGMP 3',5'-cyclic phosphodiesterase 10A-like isoform X2 [Lineus longissimus]|uniref:cAMP and cAMP-inhibited cGMP 3',5'-cyclic phosphodiesterase 10A-like isoform X2 n=1 Tax=Lineus longissimus TaxID=88925 RepID=UPI00315C8C02